MSDGAEARCPFCTLPHDRIVERTDLTTTILDAFPVSPGHTLVLTNRHVASYFDVTKEERDALWDAVDRAQGRLAAERRPAAFNVGINAGASAGQTVPHVHIHVIPRYGGDSPNPRGGVRGIISGKADY